MRALVVSSRRDRESVAGSSYTYRVQLGTSAPPPFWYHPQRALRSDFCLQTLHHGSAELSVARDSVAAVASTLLPARAEEDLVKREADHPSERRAVPWVAGAVQEQERCQVGILVVRLGWVDASAQCWQKAVVRWEDAFRAQSVRESLRAVENLDHCLVSLHH